jgi:NAD(P)-dependent dehydrogenase (short-subunit alcohol dehydrogenase family)
VEGEFAVRGRDILIPRLRRAATGSPARWQPHGTVLVTGGLGGLGAQVARRLARRGAGQLLLAGRRGEATPGADALRAELQALGADVRIVACDVADRVALARLIASVPADMPLTAVVHAAGVLDDAPAAALTPQRSADVFAAKVSAGWHLHELTRNLPLERFILFSSLAGIVGSPGQASYSAANAALDALAVHRAGRGLPATSIAWGPWAGPGMYGAPAGRIRHGDGLTALPPDVALDAMERCLSGCVTVADVDWNRFAQAGQRRRALLADLVTGGTQPTAATLFRDRLAEIVDDDLPEFLLEQVIGHVSAISGNATTAVPREEPFRQMGMDSLATIQLRNRLTADTGLRLPATVVYEHPTPLELSRHLAAALRAGQTSAHRSVVAELRRIGEELAGTGLPVGDRTEVTALLEDVLRKVRAGEGEPDSTMPPVDLDVASDAEMYSLIDTVLGAGEP